jgi:hypothetical protein
MIALQTDENCTIFTVTGEVNATDIVFQATKYISGEQTDTSIWDFSQASHVNIATVEMKGITDSIKKVSTDGKIRKVALVGSKTINIGLGKFFAAIAEIYELPYEYRVFRNIALAKEWLQENTENK